MKEQLWAIWTGFSNSLSFYGAKWKYIIMCAKNQRLVVGCSESCQHLKVMHLIPRTKEMGDGERMCVRM